jgi:Zn-dependent protease
MGAAGPIAGFIATIICFLIDGANTTNHLQPHMVGSMEEVALTLNELSTMEISGWEVWLQKIGLLPEIQADAIPLMILSDPLALKWTMSIFLDASLSPYAELGPLAFAGWVGCMITSINLFPIGQLDGGHIANALFPRHAARISKVIIFIALGLSFFWLGWLVWAGLLYFMGATKSISVPEDSELLFRSKIIAFLTGIIFVLSVMSEPIYSKNVDLVDIQWEKDIQTLKPKE